MKERQETRELRVAGFVVAVLALAGLLGCGETSGPVSDYLSEVAYNYSGTYRHPDGSSPIVTGNSGPRIRQFYVSQQGNKVTFTDEHNSVYSGNLAAPLSVGGDAPLAQFAVEGQSPARVRTAIHGTFTNTGAENFINAQWVEENGNKGVVQAVAVSVIQTTSGATTSTRTTAATTSINVTP